MNYAPPRKVKRVKKTQKTVWIKTVVTRNKQRMFMISRSSWSDYAGFNKKECRELFDAISKVVKEKLNARVNPWVDAPEGDPDWYGTEKF